MAKYIGLFFLMFGVIMVVFMSTALSKIDADKYIKAVISDKFIKTISFR